MGGPSLYLAHVDSLEAILLSCPPQTTVSDFGIGGGEPLKGAHGVLLVAAPAIGWLESALNNLALAATNNSAVLQQLTAANFALTTTVMALTATNKMLVDSVAKAWAAASLRAMAGGKCLTRKLLLRKYCWTHGHQVSKEHMSATWENKAVGHCDNATTANTMGGSNKDKGWKRT